MISKHPKASAHHSLFGGVWLGRSALGAEQRLPEPESGHMVHKGKRMALDISGTLCVGVRNEASGRHRPCLELELLLSRTVGSNSSRPMDH